MLTTVDILSKFLEMYPQFHEQICQYAPNGFNSITVWFNNGLTFDFTYFSDQNWTFRVHERSISTLRRAIMGGS